MHQTGWEGNLEIAPGPIKSPVILRDWSPVRVPFIRPPTVWHTLRLMGVHRSPVPP